MCKQGTCRIQSCVQAAKCPEPVSTAGYPPPRARAELGSSDKRRLSKLSSEMKHIAGPLGVCLLQVISMCRQRDTHKALHSRELLSLPICHLCPEVSHLPGRRAEGLVSRSLQRHGWQTWPPGEDVLFGALPGASV